MATTTESRPAATETTVSPEQSLMVSVVEAIAAARSTDPTAVDLELSDHVEFNALEAMYDHANASADASWRVQFSVEEFEVTVRNDGRITVL